MPITTEDLEAINAMTWTPFPNLQGWEAEDEAGNVWEVWQPEAARTLWPDQHIAYLFDEAFLPKRELVLMGHGYTRQQAIANAR